MVWVWGLVGLVFAATTYWFLMRRFKARMQRVCSEEGRAALWAKRQADFRQNDITGEYNQISAKSHSAPGRILIDRRPQTTRFVAEAGTYDLHFFLAKICYSIIAIAVLILVWVDGYTINFNIWGFLTLFSIGSLLFIGNEYLQHDFEKTTL